MNINGTLPKKNRNFPAILLSAALTVICLGALAAMLIKIGLGDADAPDGGVAGVPEKDVNVSVNVSGQKEMRGVWIASTLNINFPSEQGLSESALKAEIDSILETSAKAGMNAVFFQVRPAADALYKSQIFPASKYVSGKNGVMPENNFDCLEYMIDSAKKYNIEVHAWVNPYRVSMYETDIDSLSDNSPAKQHPEYTVKYADGKTYFNPGLPEVKKLVISGIKELISNYPGLSGIHYDDYFYPYPKDGADFDDNAAYEKYGNGKDKADWRRDNVNQLVKETYDAVKSINPDCSFGVSVFGIWANASSENTPVTGSDTNGLEAYSSLYCDALNWIDGGFVDYIAPQDYWSFTTSAAPFDNVARWWNANLEGKNVDLYIGHAAYKAADYPTGEIARQVEFCRSLLNYKGSIFYGYDDIKNNTGETASRLKELYSSQTYYSEPVPSGKEVTVTFPKNNATVTTEKSYVIGTSDPAYELLVNGKHVSRTKDGCFSLFETLSPGKNTYSLSQNSKTTTLTLNYGASGSSTSSSYRKMSKFEITSVSPSDSSWVTAGEKLTLACAAPSKSVVTAKIGDTVIVLSPTINPPDESDYMYEYYTAQFTPSVSVGDTEVRSLGTLTFTAEKNGKSASKTSGEISVAGKNPTAYAKVKSDYTHTKVTTSSSFYDDFLPSSAGMTDNIKTMTNGYYKLNFGGYIAKDSVDVYYGKSVPTNKISSAKVTVSQKNKEVSGGTTDICFKVTQNIPVDVDFRENAMRIIIYNTDTSSLPDIEVSANPLISSAETTLGRKAGMVIYRIKLKNDDNFYGFNIVYEDGMMKVKLNNPQKLSDGEKPLSGKVIVVDAGHGGTDTGAPGPADKNESVLNFEIASRVADELEKLGADVRRTRNSLDSTVSLYARMDILNEVNPDLAISIHHNSVNSNANALKANGFLALYSNNSGVLLAKTVSRTVCRQLNRYERTPSYQQLAVARNHRFPSALFEMSFISNIEEYQWTVTPGNYDRSAAAVVSGVLDYYRAQEAYLEY